MRGVSTRVRIRSIRYLKFSVIALPILVGACAVPEAPPTPVPVTATEAASPTQPASATPAPTPDPNRYINEEGGFSLLLPEGWTVLGPVEVSNRLERPFNMYVLGVDPSLNSGPGYSRIAVADAALWTAVDFAFAQCSTCLEQNFVDETLDGKPARRLEIGGGGVPFTTTWIFVERGENLLAFAIHDPETMEPLEDVIQSIQFIN